MTRYSSSTRTTNSSLVVWSTSLFSTHGPGDAQWMTGNDHGNVSARIPLFWEFVVGLLAFST